MILPDFTNLTKSIWYNFVFFLFILFGLQGVQLLFHACYLEAVIISGADSTLMNHHVGIKRKVSPEEFQYSFALILQVSESPNVS